MERITLQDKTFRTYIPYKDIEKAIARIAGELNRDSKKRKPCFHWDSKRIVYVYC